ncbi:Undecaprenyl-phosphate galactosephosphotransferase [Rhodopirellula islandica]|uniref:Undecaprenyl-phosphate galactosephosphotransferase n=1 Tax=Rhodopirellula islandica TaxID=595434 RepID=A0A0J1E764_RHOIS|nr:sugar transferase [Rhodopirellula islandica]KLU01299.1 Undecaprenyl-phosphate galactosephosphotransferase [Rhodopirellula islandica]
MSAIALDDSTDSGVVHADVPPSRVVMRHAEHARPRPAGQSQRISTPVAIQMGRLQAWYDVRTTLPLLVADMIAAAAAAGLSILAGIGTGSLAGTWFAVAVVTLSVMLHHMHGLYPGVGITYSVEFRRILKTTVEVCVALGLGMLFTTGLLEFPWLGWSVLSVSLCFLLSAVRPMMRRWLCQFQWWTQPVIVVGNGERAARLFERVSGAKTEGVRPVGIVFDPMPHWDSDRHESGVADTRQSMQREMQWCQSIAQRAGGDHRVHIGPIGALEEILQDAQACRVVIAERNRAARNAFQQFHGIPHVAIPTEIERHPTERVRLIEADGKIEMHCRTTLTCPKAQVVKRAMDLILVIGSMPFWLPVMAAIGVAIKVMDPGPVFYCQSRVGRYRKPFQAMKFRSMVCNADEKLREYLDTRPEMKAEWEATHKLRNDPRITWIGDFLRKSSLDELPQLWNVLRGEMSLVGPRPIIDCGNYDREYIQEHPEVFEMYQMVRPGITGLWQVSGRNDTSYQQRIHFDRYYLHNWSVTGDIFILWRTIKTALFREGAC